MIVEVVWLDFFSLPFHLRCPYPVPFIRSENLLMTDALLELEENRLIGKTVASPGQFISTVFLRYQTSGKVRTILNLFDLNNFLRYEKFNMDSIYTITQMITQDCYISSKDLSDAYFSVNIREADRQFLRFVRNDQLFEFCALPQGLASAPRLFHETLETAVCSSPFPRVRILSYLDDSYVQSQSEEHCVANISATMSLLLHLDFTFKDD